MNKPNLLKTIPIVAFAVLIFSLMLGAIILWPKFRNWNASNKEIGAISEEIKSKESYFSKLEEINAKFKEYESELSKIDSSLPDDPSMPSFFNFLQKACSQSGLVLKSISPFSSLVRQDYPQLQDTSLSLQAAGSYSAFKNLLSVLEKSARLITIGDLSFSSPKEGNIFDFSIKIKVSSY